VSRRRVLVVDDSDVTRTLLVRTLERAGFDVLAAPDGAQGAVTALRELPAVVVTDLEMPLMDGYQMLRLLKNEPASAHIPVLILTSHGEAPSRYWGLQTGADAYLTKDYDSAELVAAVTRLAEQERPAPAPDAAVPASPIEVLARVARQLDANLLRATVVNSLLEQGLRPDDLHGTARAALEVIGRVVDAHVLAIGISAPESVTLDVLLSKGVSLSAMERCTHAILAALEFQPGADIDASVSGDRDGEGDVDPATIVSFPLRLRSAAGTLALFPRDAAQFAAISRSLIESLEPHLAMVIENAHLADRLQELSTHDGLTRALNHRAIHERLTEELERGRRYHHALSVILCDLDFFKRVNDTHGHLAGDAVLRAVASTLRRTLRSSDPFGRYGGEEFLVVLSETSLEAGRSTAERLRRALADHRVALPGGGGLKVTASFGVAAANELGDDPSSEALVSLADRRLYEAKAAGRDCVRP